MPRFDSWLGKPCVAFCNEEGKLKGLDFNLVANVGWGTAMGVPMDGIGDHLVGPVCVICADRWEELEDI